MFRYDAVLFDMDGTLLDTVDDLTDALNLALEAHQFPTYGREAVTRFIGSGAYHLVQRALPADAGDAQLTSIVNMFQARYRELQAEKTRPFPGILPMLTALDEAGAKLAIISNKSDHNVKQLTKDYFGSLIHVAVGAREGMPIKPAPDMLNYAVNRLGVDPERTLYIGDAPTDLLAAQNAGLDCILVRWGYGDPDTLRSLTPLFFANDPRSCRC